MLKKASILVLAACMMLSAGFAMADSSVSWINPSCGSSFLVGTVVNPSGQASGSGITGGTGLDLMLVLDRSGSMSGTGIASAKTAANALIGALPPATTQAGLASFASSASLNSQLVSMSVPANVATLQALVNGLVASGVTATGEGIQTATTELQSVRAIAGHAKMQVVLSDGYWNSGVNPETAAAAAWAAGITVHTVGVPGHNPTEMQDIATAGHGVYTNVTNLANLVGLFNGTGGNLVALDHVNVILPNGTNLNNIAFDGLGNFILPDWSMLLGDNLFTATAYGTDGSFATATCHLYGTQVPVPPTVLLLGSGLLGLVGFRRFRKS